MPNQYSPCPIERDPSAIEEALAMTRSIADGSVEAWHSFLDHYAGLVYGVIRRFLFSEDEDGVRSVYVDVLKSLYDGALGDYRGEALLSTWLFVYARNRAMDFYRKRFGRVREPRNYDKMSEFDRKVLKLYFVERLPLEIVVSILGWCGMSTTVDDILASIQHIEETLDRRYLERLDDKYQAESYKVDSVQKLRYLIELRMEYEVKTWGNVPDRVLLEKEAMDTAKKVRAAVATLSPVEQKVLHWRYDRGWTARMIAQELKLKSQRQAYFFIDKTLAKLRKALSSMGVGKEGEFSDGTI